MSRTIRILSCLAFAIIPFLTDIGFAEDAKAEPAEPQPTMEDIFKVWKAREAKIRSIDFEWLEHRTATPESYVGEDGMIPPIDPEQLVSEFKASFSLEDNKNRYAALDQHAWHLDNQVFGLQDYTASFDGVVSKSLVFDKMGQSKHAVIHPPDEHMATKLLFVKPIWWAYRANTDHDSWARRNMTVEAGRYEVRGVKCLLLKSLSVKVWVDPARDFVIVRYANMNVQTNEIRNHLDIWYKADEGVQVPTRWKYIERNGENKLLSVTDVLVTSFSINKPFKDGHFSLTFPEGTLVTDVSKRRERRVP